MTEVILVNEQDEPVGSMEKLEAHQKALLHRAISVFIFNRDGEMLLQQRAQGKYHSALLWTNACCSHPSPGESNKDAASRRLQEEMGFSTALEHRFRFTYRTEFENGLTEHEVDHVFVGTYDGPVSPNPEEVADFKYLPMDQLEQLLIEKPESFTSWFKIALPLLLQHLSPSINDTCGK